MELATINDIFKSLPVTEFDIQNDKYKWYNMDPENNLYPYEYGNFTIAEFH